MFSVSRLGQKYCASVAYLCCKRVPYFYQNHVNGRSKTNIFASKYLECKTKSVCFNEKHANFRENTQILDFSTPYCRESKIQYPTCRVVGIPKYTLACLDQPDCTANLPFITAKSLHLPRLTNNTVGVHNSLQNLLTQSQDNQSSINQ